LAITQLPPLSLYIHVPWCVQKCPYCDFNSHQVKQNIPESEYIDRLLQDLESEIPLVWGRQLISIFIGGGTPSLFQPESYERLFSGIRALLPFNADIEITMEANPNSVESEKFKGFYDAGINRISIGVQSFQNDFLKSLGRVHNSDEAKKAFAIARNAGFNNINLDLMYALPNQSIEQALEDLQTAIDLQPEHLSWYQLTLEPNTLFYQQPPLLPDDDHIAEMASQGIQLLSKSGYQQYEISAYSRNGLKPSQHNLNYWNFGDYLGIGAGAHQKITRADEQTITRTSKRRHPKDYLNQQMDLIDNNKAIAMNELPLEFMMNALRLKEGFHPDLFFAHTGLLLGQIDPALKHAESLGLLEISKENIRASEQGYQFLNELLECFMPENLPKNLQVGDIKIKNLMENN